MRPRSGDQLGRAALADAGLTPADGVAPGFAAPAPLVGGGPPSPQFAEEAEARLVPGGGHQGATAPGVAPFQLVRPTARPALVTRNLASGSVSRLNLATGQT